VPLEGPGFPESLRGALSETGALGATIRQLAHRLADRPDRVEAALDRMERRGDVVRMGRGLWVLRAFERLEERPDFLDPAAYDERFRVENGVPLTTYRGPITFRSNESEPIHRWWPYVQGYSAEFVRGVLAREGAGRGTIVLDPFAGSGTSLVEARRAGARTIGLELLAPAALAARVKTRFELDPAALDRRATRLLRSARGRAGGPPPFLKETRRQFSPRALAQLLRLQGALPPEGRPEDDAVRLAFGSILIPSSRLHRSPCLGYGRSPPPGAPSPFERFGDAVGRMRSDLAGLREERRAWGPPAQILTSDARGLDLPEGSVDLAVTSPPYVNGLDYVMNYKVDLAWLGYARSYADLARLRQLEVACDNLPRRETEAYRGTDDPPDPWLREILPRIRQNVERKGSYRRADMHAVVHRYFVDLEQVIGRVARTLAPGGRFVLVVGDSLLAGTYVPGDLLLARLGVRHGLSVVSVEVARARRSGQRRSFPLRESVVTLERPHVAA
jgi:hypothetical protein